MRKTGVNKSTTVKGEDNEFYHDMSYHCLKYTNLVNCKYAH